MFLVPHNPGLWMWGSAGGGAYSHLEAPIESFQMPATPHQQRYILARVTIKAPSLQEKTCWITQLREKCWQDWQWQYGFSNPVIIITFCPSSRLFDERMVNPSPGPSSDIELEAPSFPSACLSLEKSQMSHSYLKWLATRNPTVL